MNSCSLNSAIGVEFAFMSLQPNRRDALLGLGSSLGRSLSLRCSEPRRARGQADSLRSVPVAMTKPRARNVIMLFREGGLGQMDTFDPKPELNRLHKTESKLEVGQELDSSSSSAVHLVFVSVRIGFASATNGTTWPIHSSPTSCATTGMLQAESLNHPEAALPYEHGKPVARDRLLGHG
ncbi:MAG: DUF1501 domain-containing protein [Pirellulaceae bacterium]